MKQIVIADQPRLGFLRTLRIAAEGIRYRLFRASVTVAVIAMAVAFLMNVMSEGLVKRAIGRDAPKRLAEMRLVHDWAERLTRPGNWEQAVLDLGTMSPGDERCREAAAMGGLSEEKIGVAIQSAREAAAYESFFDDEVGYARRRSLVHTASGADVFERLSTEEGWAQFERALAGIRTIRKPDANALRDFVRQRWPELRDAAQRIQQGRARAIARLDQVRGESSILQALGAEDGGFVRAVREAGFALDPDEAARIAEQARRLLQMRQVEASIDLEPTRQLLAQWYRTTSSEVTQDMLWTLLRDRNGAEQYLARLKTTRAGTDGLSPAQLAALANDRYEEENLTRASKLVADAQSGWGGLGRRTGWLLLVSVLVCTIGISNAMLMTVTERFREIATLKCLGALDGFIMMMFVMESCFLGLAGGMIGVIIGVAIGMGRMTAAFGFGMIRSSISAGDLAAWMALAVGAGVVLAAVAAVYPALKAARLAPMEAMRVK